MSKKTEDNIDKSKKQSKNNNITPGDIIKHQYKKHKPHTKKRTHKEAFGTNIQIDNSKFKNYNILDPDFKFNLNKDINKNNNINDESKNIIQANNNNLSDDLISKGIKIENNNIIINKNILTISDNNNKNIDKNINRTINISENNNNKLDIIQNDNINKENLIDDNNISNIDVKQKVSESNKNNNINNNIDINKKDVKLNLISETEKNNTFSINNSNYNNKEYIAQKDNFNNKNNNLKNNQNNNEEPIIKKFDNLINESKDKILLESKIIFDNDLEYCQNKINSIKDIFNDMISNVNPNINKDKLNNKKQKNELSKTTKEILKKLNESNVNIENNNIKDEYNQNEEINSDKYILRNIIKIKLQDNKDLEEKNEIDEERIKRKKEIYLSIKKNTLLKEVNQYDNAYNKKYFPALLKPLWEAKIDDYLQLYYYRNEFYLYWKYIQLNDIDEKEIFNFTNYNTLVNTINEFWNMNKSVYFLRFTVNHELEELTNLFQDEIINIPKLKSAVMFYNSTKSKDKTMNLYISFENGKNLPKKIFHGFPIEKIQHIYLTEKDLFEIIYHTKLRLGQYFVNDYIHDMFEKRGIEIIEKKKK